jgi:hypothetical protein
MKHDLSFNAARLDLVELDWALTHALGRTRDLLDKATSAFQNDCIYNKSLCMASTAKRVSDIAESLKIIANSLHYVRESLDRENITFTKGDKNDSK